MALKKKPVTGMKDIMPEEMEIREYCISVISKTYAEFGFQRIETPCVESIENLTSKSGGDNEKLIFKILKRGEKLRLDDVKSEADLVDGGLRYDLTVPLVRYYSNHENELPVPFKALQMGNVWRADRPQKGRYRQFMQCDIDIIGEPTNLAEIELILATTTTLGRLGFENFQIRINDRRILKAMAACSGFPEDRFDEVFISLDKMDKIGLDGVKKDLEEQGFPEKAIDTYAALFEGLEEADDKLAFLEDRLGGFIEEDVIPTLRETVETVEAAKQAQFRLVFDPTIVRGMSYYTGTIFEIAMPELGISAGGAAADAMTAWSASSPERMFLPADFQSALSGLSCFLWNRGSRFPAARGRRLIFWRRICLRSSFLKRSAQRRKTAQPEMTSLLSA